MKMVFIEVCVGSSCHLKGAPDIVEMLQEAVKREGAEDDADSYGDMDM